MFDGLLLHHSRETFNGSCVHQNQSFYGRTDGPVNPQRGRQISPLRSNPKHTNIGFMGLNPPHPSPLEPLQRAQHNLAPKQAILALFDRHKASRSHGISRSPHLLPFRPRLRLRGTRHRTLATARILSQVHDKGCSVYAKR